MGNSHSAKKRRDGRGRKGVNATRHAALPQLPSFYQSPLDNYKFIRTIGTGSSAIVKLATRLSDGEVVAIKIIDKTGLDSNGLKRVGQEIAVWENLDHPGVVQLYEVIATDEYFAFVCEYAPKGDLLEHIRENGRLKGKDAKRICSQLIAALAYCHQQGVVHRDLKLENVLLDVHGNAKLADWGFGRFFSVDSSSRIKEWCGSPPYAAPEIFLGRPYIGPSIDIWSLGVVFYGIVTGKLPFDSDTFDGVCGKVISGGFSVPFFMALECENLIRGMLCKSMSRRLTLVKIMAHGWLEYESQHHALGPAYRPQKERPRPRHQFLITPSMTSFNNTDGEDYDDEMGTPPHTPPPTRRYDGNGKPIRRPRANTCIGQVQPGGLSDTTGRKNRSTPPKAGAHLSRTDETLSAATGKDKGKGKGKGKGKDRQRPKSTTPETDAMKQKREEESRRSAPLKRLIEHSKRLFARIMGTSSPDGKALTADGAGSANADADQSLGSRFSLPARIEDVEEQDRAPLIPKEPAVPVEPKFRFPCVECHAPESARWNFPTQSPTKCKDCMALELETATLAVGVSGGAAGAGAGAAASAGGAAAAGGAAVGGAAVEQHVTPDSSMYADSVAAIATTPTSTAAAAGAATFTAAEKIEAARDEETPEKQQTLASKPKIEIQSAAAKALAAVKELRRKASPPKMANLDSVAT